MRRDVSYLAGRLSAVEPLLDERCLDGAREQTLSEQHYTETAEEPGRLHTLTRSVDRGWFVKVADGLHAKTIF